MQINSKTSGSADVLLFGEWLVNKGELSHENLSRALVDQRKRGGRLGQVLLRLKMINDDELTQSLADYLKLGRFRLDGTTNIDMNIARLIPERIAKRFSLLAVDQNDEKIIVAMTDPLNIIAIDTVRRRLKQPIKVLVISSDDIEKGIQMVYYGSHIEEQRLRDLLDLEVSTEEEIYKDDLLEADISNEEAATKAPVIRLVDLLLSQAVKRKASDIHIEPQEKTTVIRMRIDGVLRETVPPPRGMQAAVITRIKILSNMDIAERRLPQDGRFKIKALDRDIDVRVSSLPTIYGEKIAMRILDKKAVNHDLDTLGFEPDFLSKFKNVVRQPHGIVIVTGPTGCGKTTTLYSALNYLKDPKKNITTVENPVEYRLGGINQVQVRPEIDLGFASCLRTILRQDPDIILIGEIRDKETVEIAIQAALTGHLVLSTFHTNDAPSAITRLIYMQVEPYLLASSLNLIVAQRLVRRICLDCKEPVQPDSQLLEQLNITPERAREIVFYQGQGCHNCDHTGYLGRVPIFESLVMDDTMREAVMARATEAEIRSLAREAGGGSLLESGVRRVVQGITNAEEILEATFAENRFM
jgi:type IV pilus assembly protein PilB